MVFNATFKNISVISCRSVLLVEESRPPVASHRQTLLHNVVRLAMIEIRTHNMVKEITVFQFVIIYSFVFGRCILTINIDIVIQCLHSPPPVLNILDVFFQDVFQL